MTSHGDDPSGARPPRTDTPEPSPTPVYDALVELWRAQGREVPRPQQAEPSRPPAPAPDFFDRG